MPLHINKPTKFVQAGFKPVEGGFLTQAEKDKPHHDPVKEPTETTAEYEYSIEIACSLDELNAYQVGAFSLGKTKEEPLISSWTKTESKETGFATLTASIKTNEPKTLYREFFLSSGNPLSFYDVQPYKKGSKTVSESFVPVKPAVQVNERLGWPTEGYFYHFINEVLIHEYVMVGGDNWAFQVTISTQSQLSDELISPHQYSFMLLPWKINRTAVSRQHILYRTDKLTTELLENITADWLDEHAYLLDVNVIVEARKEKILARENKTGDTVTYIIQLGDTLSGIAHKQGITLSCLVALNPQYQDKEDHIQVGDILMIEKDEEQSNSSEHIVKINPNTNARETWSEIAEQYGLGAKELLQLNPIYEQDPTSLQVGSALFLKQSEKSETKSPRKTLPPVDLTQERTIFSWANLWSNAQSPTIHPIVATLHQLDTIPTKTPVINIRPKPKGINPKNMYWPAYDFTKNGNERYLSVEYTQEVVECCVLTPEEYTEFFANLDRGMTLHGAAKGSYDAYATAKGLGGLGVTAFVKSHNGVDYLILKGYRQHLKTLLEGNRFKASNPEIVKMGLGALDSVKGMARYVKVTAPLEVLVGSAINVLQFILNDEYTLRELGVDQAKLLIHALSVAGLALAIGAASPVIAATVIGTLSIFVVSNVIVWSVDKWTNFEETIVTELLRIKK